MTRILIVDDEVIVRKALCQSLFMLGYDVESAADGHEGLRKAADFSPALVITDINMPGNEEGRFILGLRASHPGMPVIVISGSVEDDFSRYEEAGCLALAKPFAMAELQSVLRQVLPRTHASLAGRAGGRENRPAPSTV